MPISSPPAFNPAQPPVKLGAAGTVLTVNAGGKTLSFKAGSGGGGTLSGYVSYIAAAGASNNVNPVGFGPTIHLLDVDTSAGAANFTGLIAGADGQQLVLSVTGANLLTLNAANTGSTAANRFRAAADLTLLQNGSFNLVYYGASTGVNRWVIVP